jgi:tetratricopeptide (TPR) repeat protein
MSIHLERAQLLLAQSRAADAEQEAMRALTSDPTDARALALLALSRIEQGKQQPAVEAAQEAVGLAPDVSYYHFVYGHVLHRTNREDDAFRAVQEALRLDPADPDNFALLASIELARRRWPAALEAAETALALNAEHVTALNLRSIALVRLGRKSEAMAAVDYALDRAPENAFSHANQGWNCLHQNRPKQAQEHFREALRLDPELDYAREGMLEALRARNPVYRGMLAYFLWMGRQSGRLQWLLILSVFFGTAVVGVLAHAQPEFKGLWWTLLGALYGFVYLTWTAQPMFDLLLRFDRFGRHVLSPQQRVTTNWFGATFAFALGSGGLWLVTGRDEALFAMIVLAALSICVAATFRSPDGRPRLMLGAATVALTLIAAYGGFQLWSGNEAGMSTMNGFKLGFIGFQFLANSLSNR